MGRITVRLQDDEEKIVGEIQEVFKCDKSKAMRNALVLAKLFLDSDMDRIMDIIQEKYEIEVKPSP